MKKAILYSSALILGFGVSGLSYAKDAKVRNFDGKPRISKSSSLTRGYSSSKSKSSRNTGVSKTKGTYHYDGSRKSSREIGYQNKTWSNY